jgi:hypothetical protein
MRPATQPGIIGVCFMIQYSACIGIKLYFHN